MSEEVAVFIDIENIRYGLLNEYGQEPDFSYLIDKAKKYGRPTVMKAYADFSEHPPDLTRQLQICGIEAINVPVKRRMVKDSTGKAVERVKNAADMVLALDAIMKAIEADNQKKSKTFLIVSGDRDYVRLVALLRQRFAQEVVICGIPGAVSADLERAANILDNFEVKKSAPVNSLDIKKGIVKMLLRGPSPLDYWSMKIIDDWSQNPRQAIPGTAKEKRDALSALKDENVIICKEIDDPKRGKRMAASLDEGEARKKGYI